MRKENNKIAKEPSAEEIAKLKAEVRDGVAKLRRTLIYSQPFIASIALTLDIVPTRDSMNPTAATDGRSIFFDVSFWEDLKPEERIFVIAHEIWHNVLIHSVRQDGRDNNLFNVACDLEVNQLLAKDGFVVPKSACMPASFQLPADKSAEEYYELLMQKADEDGMPGGMPSGMHGAGSGGPGSSNGSPTSGNMEGKLEGQFDRHITQNETKDGMKGTQPGTASDKYGVVGSDPDFNPDCKKENVEATRQAAVAAVQQIQRSRGTVPAHLASLIEKLLEPEVNWKDVLSQFVTRSFGDRREWNPPNRRHVWHGSYLQSRRGNKIRIAVAIDTSGSTMGDMPQFLGELNGILKTFSNYELTLLQCDAQIQDVRHYDGGDELDLENEKFEVCGGGGTVISPVFEWMKDNDEQPDCMVVFTDGYHEQFTEDDAMPYPVLWVISHGGTKENAGFGEVVNFEAA